MSCTCVALVLYLCCTCVVVLVLVPAGTMPYVRIQLFRGWNSACDIEIGTKNEGVLDWTMPTLLDLQQTKQAKKTKRRNGVVGGGESGGFSTRETAS